MDTQLKEPERETFVEAVMKMGGKTEEEARKTGTSPNNRQLRALRAAVKRKTRQSRERSTAALVRKPGREDQSSFAPAQPRAIPNTPPAAESRAASERSCPMRRMRPEPSATRMPISRPRRAARASDKLARLAQAMRSTKPTATLRAMAPPTV